jgi:hypothetical protein
MFRIAPAEAAICSVLLTRGGGDAEFASGDVEEGSGGGGLSRNRCAFRLRSGLRQCGCSIGAVFYGTAKPCPFMFLLYLQSGPIFVVWQN